MELEPKHTDRITRLGLAILRRDGIDVDQIIDEHMRIEHSSETGKSGEPSAAFGEANERFAHEKYLVDLFIAGKEIKF